MYVLFQFFWHVNWLSFYKVLNFLFCIFTSFPSSPCIACYLSFIFFPSPEDRISELPQPDEILLAILSSQAFRTSVISTRWMSLWMHTSRLDFNVTIPLDWSKDNREFSPKETRKFVARVNCVLQLHEASALEEFRVCFEFDI